MKKYKFRAKCVVDGEIILFTDEKEFRKVVRQAVSNYYKQNPVTEKTYQHSMSWNENYSQTSKKR